MVSDTNVSSTSLPEVAHPVVFTAGMLEAWALHNGWRSVTDAVAAMGPEFDLRQLVGAFIEAAGHLHRLLPAEQEGIRWSLGEVLEEICSPFAKRFLQHVPQFDYPPEPIVRDWLQDMVEELFLGDGGLRAPGRPFVVTLVLMVPGDSYVDAVAAAAEALAEPAVANGADRFLQFWMMSPSTPRLGDSCWCVPAALEVKADTLQQALEHAGDWASYRFGTVRQGWEYGKAEGMVVRQWSIAPPGAPLSEPGQQDQPSPLGGGQLPAHMR